MQEARIAVEGYFGGVPQPRQFYETTLILNVGGLDVVATVGSVPARSMDLESRAAFGQLEGLAGLIGGGSADAVVLTTVSEITTAVGLMIDPQLKRESSREPHPVWGDFRQRAGEPYFVMPPWWRHPIHQATSPIPAAEYLVFNASIPAEKSDLSGHTISKIVGGSGGTALVAAVFAGAATPWLLVAVPAGVILMKVADGAGDALHDVVKYKILKRLAPELIGQKPGGPDKS